MSAKTIAFLFPGQGAVPKSLPQRTPWIDDLLARAERAGIPLPQWIAEEDESHLMRTSAAQPALFIDSIARERRLREAGILPSVVAGHSLGEYAALTSAGMLTPSDALSLVLERGRLMDGIDGGMVAVVKLSIVDVEAVCREVGSDIGIANLNSPAQVVVSGTKARLERVAALVKERGGRAIPLKVSGPFHSPLMRPAETALAPRLREATFHPPHVPVVSAVTGTVVEDVESLRSLMLRQITSPVRWIDVVRALEDFGVTLAVEVGDGATLTGLGPRISERIRFVTYEEVLDGEL